MYTNEGKHKNLSIRIYTCDYVLIGIHIALRATKRIALFFVSLCVWPPTHSMQPATHKF